MPSQMYAYIGAVHAHRKTIQFVMGKPRQYTSLSGTRIGIDTDKFACFGLRLYIYEGADVWIQPYFC